MTIHYRPIITLIVISALTAMFTGCRDEVYVIPAEYEQVCPPSSQPDAVAAMYVINEGNMGSNKASIDMLDFTSGVYMRNIYASRNPTAVKELGDVANDALIYGSRLYVTVNCSHKVEIMDAYTLRRIGHIDIPNCRYLACADGHVYVSSYVSSIVGDNAAPAGCVCEIDTSTLAVTRRATVGYQPEEMAIIDGLLYVANSGGYRPPDYDNTISVVDLASFTQLRRITVDINLHRLRADSHGALWVTSRGDNATRHGALYKLQSLEPGAPMQVVDRYDIPCSDMAMRGDSLIYIASQWNNLTATATASYGIIDVHTGRYISQEPFQRTVTESIARPYAIAVHPTSGDIYLTDAKNYVSSGTLYCLDPTGHLRWSVRTGDIPAAIAFLSR